MQSSRDESIKLILESEGGYTNEATDPGGPTNFGITIFDARMYLNPHLSLERPWTKESTDFMRHMTLDQAVEIYRSKYWAKVRGDELPAGLDYTLVDYGVNSGVHRAIMVIQRIVGMVDDGKLGPLSMAAILEGDPADLITKVNDERMSFLRRLSIWPVYKNGWSSRVARVRAKSLSMLEESNV